MKQWGSIAVGLSMVAFSFLSYALVDLQNNGASANTRKGNPPPVPSRVASPLRADTVQVPTGTRIHIRLNEGIRIEKDTPRDDFTAVLYGPLIVGTNFLAPSRSKIIGQLTQAIGHGAEADGQWTMVLRKLLVNGKEYDIATDPVALDSTNRDLGIQGSPIVYGPESQLTFALSEPLELPVIRSMGDPKDGSVDGGNQ